MYNSNGKRPLEASRKEVCEVGTLDGKVAVVTGASRGIGRAVAERLGRDGARVVVNYVQNSGKAQEVVEAVQASGSQAVAVQADIGRVKDARRLFQAAEERFGGVDVVINNASVSVFKPHAEVSEEEFDRVFGLIARGTFFALQEAANRLRDGGRIVTISSGGTVTGGAGAGLYLGAKAAVEQFSLALAKELGPRGIRVNAVLPGLTDTDGMIMPPEAVEQAVNMTPLGRLGQPEDIADVVAFLVGEDGRWMTGQLVRAGGGLM
jgi:3-oxoacyl-[acyl-carrier protein] reductase